MSENRKLEIGQWVMVAKIIDTGHTQADALNVIRGREFLHRIGKITSLDTLVASDQVAVQFDPNFDANEGMDSYQTRYFYTIELEILPNIATRNLVWCGMRISLLDWSRMMEKEGPVKQTPQLQLPLDMQKRWSGTDIITITRVHESLNNAIRDAGGNPSSVLDPSLFELYAILGRNNIEFKYVGPNADQIKDITQKAVKAEGENVARNNPESTPPNN